jgi:hypothetical protein
LSLRLGEKSWRTLALPFPELDDLSSSFLLPLRPFVLLDGGIPLGKVVLRDQVLVLLGDEQAGLLEGRRLGIFKPHEERAKKAREKERGERFWIEVCGRPVPATNTDEGIRGVRGRNPIDPDSVRR